MILSLEITLVVGAFVVTLAGAAQKRPRGLAWMSDRGRRTWQMYSGVSWEPGRAEHFLPKRCRIGKTGLTSPGVTGTGSPSCNKPSGRHKEKRETREGITYRQREEVRRMFGSLSTLIVPIESRETYPGKPVSREGECRVMDPLLRNTPYTRR
jgi:hypothetical protein